MKNCEKFIKYQSLGNDFIILDWLEVAHPFLEDLTADQTWISWVKNICHRNFGIGADGVLILTHNGNTEHPQVWIFNQDGSNGQTCLNGVRCVIDYLHTHHGYPTSFKIQMGKNLIDCSISSLEAKQRFISTIIPYSKYQEPLTVAAHDRTFSGHTADVGNPHFLIFDHITHDQLLTFGTALEKASIFPNGSNISFIWPLEKEHEYSVLVHERGVGPTLACGSAGVAIIRTLHELGKITSGEEVSLQMPGGLLKGFITDQNEVCLLASAQTVFKGTFIQ